MGIEATLTFALGGVTDDVRELARANAGAGEVAGEILRAVARSSGSVAAWAMTRSKWLSDRAPSFEDLSPELEAFVVEVHRANPDARFVASYETDHDDGDRAFWYERGLAGAEEGGGLPRWERFDLACRVYPSDEPEEDEGLRAPRWSTRARHVWVLACDGPIAAGARAKSALVRACLDGLASSGAWSPRAEDGPIDVLDLARGLRGLGTVLVGYQPDADRAKLVRIDEKTTHYDLPFGVVWSPALVAAASRALSAVAKAPAPEAAPDSPLRADALAKLEQTPIQGMINEPVFRDLAARSTAERRLLACDLAAKRPAPPVDQRASALVILLLEYSDLLEDGHAVAQLLACEAALPIGGLVAQLERFVAKGPLDEAAARAVLGSPALTALAAKAPTKPDRYAKKEKPWRARAILRAAQGAPPFPVEPWATAIADDVARMPKKIQGAWREAFAAWDAAPPPYSMTAAWLEESVTKHLGPVADAAATAAAWLSAFAGGAAEPRDARDERFRRNVAVLEGLVALADREVLRAVAAAAFAPLASGAARCPRLGYRALDALARARDRDGLRDFARDARYERARRYAAELDRGVA